ncbi:DUF4290 domain-containing protein [Panacibacter sp. DH6]|uniref:DUF4290 domain-containing protein n=1 Tax=Panacibacter microcysteis TaxID=2793269 RepID=A0A931E7F3_9BACT|nr:DUF4290 domain-containing protein [Panacibacter microcysteis]MBG9375136.1 DUF4290 domain-containing protein [Panacibacter microcysteis]
MEYNTSRSHMVMREYGRHIQNMVDYVLTIEDPKKRQQQAQVVIELMGFLNPHLKNVEDFRHKLWDHLFFMSDFKLKVDSPYPIPEKATYKAKPAPLPYPKRYPKYSHLGKNLELVIDKALKEDNAEKKAGFAHAIAYYMKLSYSNWHKELVHDDNIRSELNAITGGELEFSNTPYIKHRNQNFERDDYGRGSARSNDRDRGGRQQSYMSNGRNNNGGRNMGGRDRDRDRDNRGGGGRSPGGRDNRDSRGGGGNGNNRNQNFKKRFK